MSAPLHDAAPDAPNWTPARFTGAGPLSPPAVDFSDGRQVVDPAFVLVIDALAQLGSPALIFDETRKVLVANQLIVSFSAVLRARPQAALAFVDRAADASFRQIAAGLAKAGELAPGFIAMRCASGEATIARILPLGSVLPVEPAPRVGMLIFFPLANRNGPSTALLQSLFALTPAEAIVARSLAEGTTINEFATAARISCNTVRSHVRAILQKTGCRRQSEAVGLFWRIGAAGVDDESRLSA